MSEVRSSTSSSSSSSSSSASASANSASSVAAALLGKTGPQPHMSSSSWTYSFAAGSQGQLTGQRCSEALTALLRHSFHVLPMAVESSSHPSGLDSLRLQPYSYAGGGLGNVDECPLLTCLALQPGRDGMPPYAGVCVPPECHASDLTSYDFVATLRRIVPDANPQQQQQQQPQQQPGGKGTTSTAAVVTAEELQRQGELANEYVTIFERINEIGNYLPSGWTCGEWRYPIPLQGTSRILWWSFVSATCALLLGTATGTYRGWHTRRRKRRRKLRQQRKQHGEPKMTRGEWEGSEDSEHSDEAERLVELHRIGAGKCDDRTSSNWTTGGSPSEERFDRALLQTPTSTTTPLTASTATGSRWSPEIDADDARPLLLRLSSPVPSLASSSPCLNTTHVSPPVSSKSSTPLPASSSSSPGKGRDFLRSVTPPSQKDNNHEEEKDVTGWEAFDWRDNHARMVKAADETSSERNPTLEDNVACLHGIRVLSLLWIVLGHTAAITSSTGPGYSNPGDVLPPHGWAITLPGQLIFASRFAVDTFLVLSGFLLVVTATKMFATSSGPAPSTRTGTWPIVMVVSRIARIVPTYLTCLGIFVFVAPRYWGSGAFWYQWQGLLQPCTEYGWTNLLFVNNFYPTDTSTTNTCFYHSWYLAVDVQVFVLGVLILVVYRRSPLAGLACATGLFAAMTVMQAVLTHERNWSLNTFDGAAVARYDVEAYAKPHVRAPSYLAGMICAMVLLRKREHERAEYVCPSENGERRDLEDSESRPQGIKNLGTTATVLACCATMGFVTFCTASGAYARRPCQYGEWPHEAGCGSLWSPRVTVLYTAFSRTLWVLAISILIFLMCGTRVDGSREPPLLLQLIRSFLSLPLWTLPSKLSFASYLMHPTWLFVWQLGAPSSKYAWRWTTFAMQYMAVCVMTLASSYVISVVVEAPCARLWKSAVTRMHRRASDSVQPRPRSSDQDCRSRDTERCPVAHQTRELTVREKTYQKSLKYGSVDGV